MMIHFKKEAYLPYSVSDVYDLVNDTESYQLFLPYCQKSEVLSQEGHEKYCSLIFSIGLLSRTIQTRNVLHPKEKIEIFLHQGDFKHLKGTWCFQAEGEGTYVQVIFDYEFDNPIVAYTFGQVFTPMIEEIVAIFQKRADDVLC